MSVIAHNGKVVVSGGKTLNFDNLITLANNTTGENDTTLTNAVQSLIDGYGGGGILPAPTGFELVTNEFDFTPAVDSNPDITLNHGLGVMPAYILCSVNDVEAILGTTGKDVLISGFYYSGSGYAEELNVNYGLNKLFGINYGGYFKRQADHTLRSEAGTTYEYYIRNVNDVSFDLGNTGAYVWPAGVTIHVSCFGFKKKVM